MSSLSLRSRLAVIIAHIASKTSRTFHKGQGAIIGGIVALKISPRIITELSHDKQTVLVTGTNGKSTTTRLIATILSNADTVATQIDGANMDAGIATALITNITAPYAALEVDELHVSHIGSATNPKVCVILNLSRDQLDRYGEISTIERTLRKFINSTSATIVANCDDVLVSSTAYDSPNVIWVAAGSNWHNDSISCPRTGEPIFHQGPYWYSTGDTQFCRPEPVWWFDEENIYGPQGFLSPLQLNLPGLFNRANATMAVAASVALDIDPLQAIQAIKNLHEVSGRYRVEKIGNHTLRLLLAKNPASWQESLALTIQEPPQGIIMSVNSEIQDGQDTSWLWDIDFERLVGDLKLENLSQQNTRPVIICSGKRASDLAVRLEYAGLPYTVADNPLDALHEFPTGRVDILANYTAFLSLNNALNTQKTTSQVVSE